MVGAGGRLWVWSFLVSPVFRGRGEVGSWGGGHGFLRGDKVSRLFFASVGVGLDVAGVHRCGWVVS